MVPKMRLFDTLLPKGAPAVNFADGHAFEEAANVASTSGLDVRTVGQKGNLKRLQHRQVAQIHDGDQVFEVAVPLIGGFQIANAILAIGLAMSTGMPAPIAMKAAETLAGAAGRLELVGTTAEGAPAYVDYAHKPEALEAVVIAARAVTTERLVAEGTATMESGEAWEKWPRVSRT
ncbi:UDP-N-acetylmuramoyl-L-alanyl-D-glutamate--2, 6-diaminopimelate ligase (plasmid) [Sinorhizobium americanum CCGM7]|nr:Mur ligase family protein [Sinorhizobium americanum]APG86916.1 UDP-N-acetylmuramoyl-L-alanyl-D-glutamate--2, 6-diaminopimelate ligase [Sinorhizobium americanum CCGM7]